MAGKDLERALSFYREWGLNWVDLRDSIYGKTVPELDLVDAERARAALNHTGLELYCLSTSIMFADIDQGERHFRNHYLDSLDKTIAVAKVLRPRLFRLIGAVWRNRPHSGSAISIIRRDYPWLIEMYREAIDKISQAGMLVTIENEAPRCILSSSDEVIEFFEVLGREEKVGFTWDIQNQWACGVFPSLLEYSRLKPFIQYVHVKGGQYEDPETKTLKWNVSLADANWPVREIVAAIAQDGVSPVLCLNVPSHGIQKPNYDYDGVTKRDLDYLLTIEGVR